MTTIDNRECLQQFGDFIRAARVKKKLSQCDVAQMVGITQAYYSLIERGEREVDLVLSLKICNALHLNMKKFVGLYL